MAAWELTAATLSRLRRRLELENDADELLRDVLEDTADELRLYLHRDTLPDVMAGAIIQLAALNYYRMQAERSGVKAWSYSEGEQTQSETPVSGADYEAEKAGVLAALASYRQVGVKEVKRNEAAEHAS